MSKLSRWFTGVAALLLALVYVTPLWKIDLLAPQYPEGVGMRIWVNDIRGARPADLQSINGLNHYVGMAVIDPANFPELRYMPWVVAGLIGLGLLVALLGKRPLLYGYAALFAGLAALGLFRFQQWGYNYGHTLDPTAAIKIPGAAYDPPVIGVKKILNFTAMSWPDIGGIAAFVAGGLIFLAVVLEWRRRAAAPAGWQPA
jgi:copper chaperone NosL